MCVENKQNMRKTLVCLFWCNKNKTANWKKVFGCNKN